MPIRSNNTAASVIRITLERTLQQEFIGVWQGEQITLLDLSMQGTFTSLHLAAQSGVDPGPIAALDWIKAQLAR